MCKILKSFILSVSKCDILFLIYLFFVVVSIFCYILSAIIYRSIFRLAFIPRKNVVFTTKQYSMLSLKIRRMNVMYEKIEPVETVNIV